jgi:ferredoxin-NADP reductase
MDQGWVARYTKGDTPNNLPIIINLYAPVDTWGADEAPRGLPAWFLSALMGLAPTFAMLCRGFDMLPQDNWGYVVEIDHFHALDEQCQSTSVQIDQLLVEMEMLRIKQQLSQGRLEMGRAAQQVEHLHLGQHGARREHKRVHVEAVQANRCG